MRVDKSAYRSLVDMLSARRPGTDEVEAVFVASNGDDAIRRDSAKRLLGYLVDPGNGYATVPGSPFDTLDVSVNGMRFTYDGAALVALRAAASGGSSGPVIAPGRDGQTVTVMRKERVRPSVGLPDYRLRVNMKSEHVLEGAAAAIALSDPLLSGPTRGEARVYRRKLRYSFLPTGEGEGGVRVDVTAVRQLQLAPRGEASPTVQTVSTQRETYEVEVELVEAAVDGARQAQLMLSHFGVLLKVVDDTDELMSVSERATVIREYDRLVGGGGGGGGQQQRSRFVGPKPVSLELAHLACAAPGVVPCATRDYTVTDKADGERRLLFVASDRRVYTINERLAVRATGMRAKRLSDCLLDGEHLPDRFLAFDALFVAGQDVRALPLMAPPEASAPSSRKTKPKKEDPENDGRRPAPFRDRLDAARRVAADVVADASADALADASADAEADEGGYEVSVKEFRRVTDARTLAEACRHVLLKRDTGRLQYHIDGLILTPALMPLPQNGNRWDDALKWKPPDQNTIDFKVRMHGADTGLAVSGDVVFQVADLLVGQDPWLAEQVTALDYLTGQAAERLRRLRRPPGAPPAYECVPFRPADVGDQADPHVCYLPKGDGGLLRCKNGEEIVDGLIVEFAYDTMASGDGVPTPRQARWVPQRVRWDKTMPNNAATAEGVWGTILSPVTEAMVTSVDALEAALKSFGQSAQSSYYVSKLRSDQGDTGGLRRFHNNWVKREALLMRFTAPGLGRSIFDFGCGRAGDLPKWIDMGATRVLGIDKYASNLYNPDGDLSAAYVRLLRAKGHVVPASTSAGRRKQQPVAGNRPGRAAEALRAVFLPMDASRPIYTQDYIEGLDERSGDRAVAKALWGLTPIAGVKPAQLHEYHNFAANPFDLATCMFVVHYVFESRESLATFARNVASVLRPGGHFVGCCLDGRLVHEMLEREAPSPGDAVRAGPADAPSWRITRRYGSLGHRPAAEPQRTGEASGGASGGRESAIAWSDGGGRAAAATATTTTTYAMAAKPKAVAKPKNLVPTAKAPKKIKASKADSTAAEDAGPYGRRIDVFMESIGQEVPEFLFDYSELLSALADVGLRPVDGAEAAALGLVGSVSTGTFEALFEDMQRRNPRPPHPPSVTAALAMTDDEKRYSFLNRWFVFKKAA